MSKTTENGNGNKNGALVNFTAFFGGAIVIGGAIIGTFYANAQQQAKQGEKIDNVAGSTVVIEDKIDIIQSTVFNNTANQKVLDERIKALDARIVDFKLTTATQIGETMRNRFTSDDFRSFENGYVEDKSNFSRDIDELRGKTLDSRERLLVLEQQLLRLIDKLGPANFGQNDG